MAQLKDCFSVPDTECCLLANEPVTVLSAYVLLTGTLPLLTLPPHRSIPCIPKPSSPQ